MSGRLTEKHREEMIARHNWEVLVTQEPDRPDIADRRILLREVAVLTAERDEAQVALGSYAGALEDATNIASLAQDARQERDEAYKLLHDLTPMGSEFVNDPKRCYQWIRNQQEKHTEMIVDTHARLNKAEAERDEARAIVAAMTERSCEGCAWWTEQYTGIGKCDRLNCLEQYDFCCNKWEAKPLPENEDEEEDGSDRTVPLSDEKCPKCGELMLDFMGDDFCMECDLVADEEGILSMKPLPESDRL